MRENLRFKKVERGGNDLFLLMALWEIETREKLFSYILLRIYKKKINYKIWKGNKIKCI